MVSIFLLLFFFGIKALNVAPIKPTITSSLGAIEQWQIESLKLVNKYRASYGLHNLCLSKKLNRSASLTAQWIAELQQMDHNLVIGVRETALFNDFILVYAAENLYSSHYSPLPLDQLHFRAFEAWRHSNKGHNETMLSPFPTHMGISRAVSPQDPHQVYFVQHFGTNAHESCDYIYQAVDRKTRIFAPDQITRYNSIKKIIDKEGNFLEEPTFSPLMTCFDYVMDNWHKNDFVEAVKTYEEYMESLPSNTTGYPKWQEVKTNSFRDPQQAITTKESQPSRQLPMMLDTDSSVGDQDFETAHINLPLDSTNTESIVPVHERRLQDLLIRYYSDIAMGIPNASTRIEKWLNDPQVKALITKALKGLGLVNHFKDYIDKFVESIDQSTGNWLFSIWKGRNVGQSDISKQAQSLVDLLAIYNAHRQVLPKDCSRNLTDWMKEPIPFNVFFDYLRHSIAKMQFHHVHLLLKSMLYVIKPCSWTNERTSLDMISEVPQILTLITQEVVPSSLLGVFIESSGHLNNFLGIMQIEQLADPIMESVKLRHPIYQVSALMVLGKYGSPAEQLQIKVPQKYSNLVTLEFAQFVSQLIQYFYGKSDKSKIPLPTGLKPAEISMLEKLLKNSQCLNPQTERKEACIAIISTTIALRDFIEKYLLSLHAPNLALLLEFRNELALEGDLGIYMVARKTYLNDTIPSQQVSAPARLLGSLSQSEPTRKLIACGQGKSNILILNMEWKKLWSQMGMSERRGFIRALIYWSVKVPPYLLPDAPYSNEEIVEAFDTHLSLYCEKVHQMKPLTSLIEVENTIMRDKK